MIASCMRPYLVIEHLLKHSLKKKIQTFMVWLACMELNENICQWCKHFHSVKGRRQSIINSLSQKQIFTTIAYLPNNQFKCVTDVLIHNVPAIVGISACIVKCSTEFYFDVTCKDSTHWQRLVKLLRGFYWNNNNHFKRDQSRLSIFRSLNRWESCEIGVCNSILSTAKQTLCNHRSVNERNK